MTASTAAGIARISAHPAWLVERWVATYGLEAAAAICAFDQEQPPLQVRIASSQAEESLLQEGVELAPANFLTSAKRVTKGDVTVTVTYRKGLVRIQDEGSQLVAELAGARLLTSWIAALRPVERPRFSPNAIPLQKYVACDVSMRRLEQMKGLLRALPEKTQVRFQVADAAKMTLRE